MRHNQSTLRPAVVHAYARQMLVAELELKDYQQAVPAGVLARVLLLAACWQCSLSAACPLLRDAPSHESVRKALHACLPPRPLDLLARLLAALRRSLPDHLGRRPLPMALDLHQRPYYGKFTRGCTRRKKKKSTRKSFTYATLAVFAPEGRFSVGLLLTRPWMRHTTILQRLLDQAQAAGLSVSYLLLDKEFYALEVMAWLQRRRVPYLMPTRQNTSRPPFDPGRSVGWYEHTWEGYPKRRDFATGESYRAGRVRVSGRVCVARHPKKGKRLTYASWGLGKWPPAVVVQEYRRRFGIETAYRQLGQCLAQTSSKDERVRLLLVGVALLLCNVWACLHSEAFGLGALGERRRQLPLLRLLGLRLALAWAIVTLLGGLVDQWPTQRPLPPELTQPESTE
jgi:Transposase DDE domain